MAQGQTRISTKNYLGNESNIFLLEIKLSNLQKLNIKVTRLKWGSNWIIASSVTWAFPTFLPGALYANHLLGNIKKKITWCFISRLSTEFSIDLNMSVKHVWLIGKNSDAGNIEGRRRRGQYKMRSSTQWTWVLANSGR